MDAAFAIVAGICAFALLVAIAICFHVDSRDDDED